MYSPAVGRFLQTDSIGSKDDLNLYAYAGNNPLNNADPTGHAGVSVGSSYNYSDSNNSASLSTYSGYSNSSLERDGVCTPSQTFQQGVDEDGLNNPSRAVLTLENMKINNYLSVTGFVNPS